MSLLTEPSFDTLRPIDIELAAMRRETPLSLYTGLSLGHGFDESLAGRVIEEVQTPAGRLPTDELVQADGLAGASAAIARSADSMARRSIDRAPAMLTEEQWQASPHFRAKIPYSAGMTEPRAEALAASYDYRRWRDSVYERYEGGIGGQALGLGAQMLGGAASPENYIPILGPAVRAAAVARLGTIAGRAAVGSAEAMIGTVLVAPLVYPSLNVRGEDLGAPEIAMDIALSGVIGAGFGTVGGVMARRRDAAEALRLQGAQRAIDILDRAADAMARGEPVDVGRMAEPFDAEFRRKLLRSTAISTADPMAGPLFRIADAPDGVLDAGARDSVAPGVDPGAPAAPGPATPLPRDVVTVDAELTSGEVGPVEVSVNPRPADVGRMFRDADTATRLLVDRDTGDIYAWNGDRALHDSVADSLGVDRSRVLGFALSKGRPFGEQWSQVQAASQGVRQGIDAAAPNLGAGARADRAAGQAGEQAPSPPPRADAPAREGLPLRAAGPGPAPADPITAAARDFVTTESAEARHPSVDAAAARLASWLKPRDEVDGLAADLGIEDDGAVRLDLDELRRQGRVTAEDEAALTAADDLAKTAEGYAQAFETLATCTLRYAA